MLLATDTMYIVQLSHVT